MLDLLANAIVSGLLLGGFYAAVTVGLSIAFGMLEIVNIAHPTFVMLGSFVAYAANLAWGLDPILAGIVAAPFFYALGAVLYRVYHLSFEQHGQDSLRGLVFFFGIMFIAEVALILIFGVDYRLVETPSSTTGWSRRPIPGRASRSDSSACRPGSSSRSSSRSS